MASRSCSQCRAGFALTERETAFYQKAGLPFPRWCPLCRVKRRMAWRNDRTFYERKCDLSGGRMISIYPPDTPFPVYHPDAWYSDRWDPLAYGRELSLTRPFFEQWRELMLSVPRLGIDIVNCQNSYYCNYCGDDKNCYLDIAGEANEDCYYNLFTKYSRDVVDCTFVYHSELCCESILCNKCYNVLFAIYLDGCHDCSFSFDLKGCSNCLFCSNLRRKDYHLFNQPCSKSDFEQACRDLQLDTAEGRKSALAKWTGLLKNALQRGSWQTNCENCSGNDLSNSKNCHSCFNTANCEDCGYLYDVLDACDCYDLNYSLYRPEASCELISTLSMKFSAYSMASHYCSEVYYCDMCNNSSDLFGCIGLNHKSYCILNRQYSADEYRALMPKLRQMMTDNDEFGSFFPPGLSPFGYNETVSAEYFPLTEEQAAAAGFNWRTEQKLTRETTARLHPRSLNDALDIANGTLSCEQCSKPYRVISQELRFYHRLGLSLPTTCPKCRHLARMVYLSRRELVSTVCASCRRPIKSAAAATRAQLLCDLCYVKAVHDN